MKKTLILGASIKPERYSYKAAQKLLDHGHPIEMIGRREDILFDKTINSKKIEIDNLDTVTLYLSPRFQVEYYDYILSLNPKRVIFNPGTENPEFQKILSENNIEFENACTLVLLATNSY
ncbi:MAG: CoA-binding protein [Prolixibacteraceae bacterium]|jgi:predicted CoA-binding protein|nr:CoA-binding protein [Prolixibacteraceae bacterium]